MQVFAKLIIFLFFASALLFGAKSQIVPVRFAKGQDRFLNCDWVGYLVRNTATPGWNCAVVDGLSPTLVSICGAALLASVACLTAFNLPSSKVNRGKIFLSRFIVCNTGWIAAASGFTFMFRVANFALGRLHFDALLYPSLMLTLSMALLLYLNRNLESLW